MSKATELAEAEALAAEAEHPDEPEPENPDAEPVEPIEPDEAEEAEHEETEPEPASSLRQVEDQEKLLAAESKRHAKALAKALGAQFADFELCPLCQVDGYAIAYQPGEVGPEQREAVMVVLGEANQPVYKNADDAKMCTKCDGWGNVLTGAKTDAGMLKACMQCNGLGYTLEAPTNVYAITHPPVQPWEEPAQVVNAPGLSNDPWGRVPGQVNYGQDPALNGGVW